MDKNNTNDNKYTLIKLDYNGTEVALLVEEERCIRDNNYLIAYQKRLLSGLEAEKQIKDKK